MIDNNSGVGLAGSHLVSALIDVLVQKGVLSKEDVKKIASDAQNALVGPGGNVDAARFAGAIYDRFRK